MEPLDKVPEAILDESINDPYPKNSLDTIITLKSKQPEVKPVGLSIFPTFSLSDLREPDIKITMKEALKWVLARVKEGSTWAGLGVLAAAFGVSQELAVAGVDVIVASAGLIAILLKDKASDKGEPK